MKTTEDLLEIVKAIEFKLDECAKYNPLLEPFVNFFMRPKIAEWRVACDILAYEDVICRTFKGVQKLHNAFYAHKTHPYPFVYDFFNKDI